MACGRGRSQGTGGKGGAGRGGKIGDSVRGRRKEHERQSQVQTCLPATKRRKLTASASATSSERNASSCSKQGVEKKALKETPGEETIKKMTKKNKTKAMNKSDRESLLLSLHNIDEKILRCDVVTKLTATFEDNVLLKDFTNIVCLTEQPLQSLILHHLQYFAALYVSSKK